MAACGAAAVLFVLTHIPQRHVPAELGFWDFDKSLHVAAYGLLTFFWLKALRAPGAAVLTLVGAALAAFGAVDEYTQQFVGRSASAGDWLANVVGVSLVIVGFLGWQKLAGQVETG